MIIKPENVEIEEKTDSVTRGVSTTKAGILKVGEIVVCGDGLHNFLDYVEKNFPKARKDGSSSKVGKAQGGSSWWGEEETDFHEFETYEETLDVFRNNPESLVKFRPAEIQARQFEEAGKDVEYDVTGDFIDMGRFMEGIPESMGQMHNGNVRSRRVRIIVDNSHAWFVDAKDILNRSERIIRIIDALEAANIRTELTVIDSGGCAHIEVIIKRFDEPLTLEDVAISTHPDFLRRIGFRISEHSKTFESGYGSSINLKKDNTFLNSDINDELTIFCTGISERDVKYKKQFDELESILEEELSLEVPTLKLIKVWDNGTVEKQGF